MDCKKIWAELQDAIKNALEAEVSYIVHIKTSTAVWFENSIFTIAVPTSINKSMIDFRFKNKIESILEAYTGQKVTLNVILETEIKQFMENKDNIVIEERKTDTQKRDLSLFDKYTFDNLVILMLVSPLIS